MPLRLYGVITHCFITEFRSSMAIVVICCCANRGMRILRMSFFMYWNEVSVCVCRCNKYHFFDSLNDHHGKGKRIVHPKTGHEAPEGE